ncbi:MAG: hypothetical protein JSV97_10340 [candidate division WOR-3 bacterium]|nr:MAG: hypothetical protein JSV97_10340 [candidate division WOR-3 bacterium]
MKSYNVGLLGFGNVNIAFVNHYVSIADKIAEDYGFRLQFVALCDSKSIIYDNNLNMSDMVKCKEQKRPAGEECTDPLGRFLDLIVNKKFDILVDGLPTSKTYEGPTFPLLIEALKQNITIICANKAPLVFRGKELLDAAQQHNSVIGLSGTTAGSLPTSGVMMNELAGTEIVHIRAIVNGTSNYVLDSIMFGGLTLDEAIHHAVELGIAEPDYQSDLDGTDTCFKMIILGLLVTGENVHPNDVPRTGILELKRGYITSAVKQEKVFRLIGTLAIENNSPRITVAPEILDETDALYSVHGTGKGIIFKTKHMGELIIIEGSSSRTSIAATILKDIINVCKH